MKLLLDFFPVLLFFIAFKWYGIYVATVVGIIATALQVFVTFITKKQFDKQQIITFAVFVLFGGMTLYFHNPIFVKWKPTIVFWIFSLVFFMSHFIGKKPLLQRMMEPALSGKGSIPEMAWKKLSLMWIVFFALLGTINLFIAYHYSTDTWVNFKLYGILGLLLLFSIVQSVYLMRYISEEK